MKKANKADIYFIESNPENLDVVKLAKVTGLTNTQVKNILAKVKEETVVHRNNIETQFDKSVAKHKNRNGVLMMTEGASQIIDSSRSSNIPKDTSSFITKARK